MCVVGFQRYVACILWMFVQLHLISALDMQDNNRITSLKGVVFPAGLTKLDVVSFLSIICLRFVGFYIRDVSWLLAHLICKACSLYL